MYSCPIERLFNCVMQALRILLSRLSSKLPRCDSDRFYSSVLSRWIDQIAYYNDLQCFLFFITPLYLCFYFLKTWKFNVPWNNLSLSKIILCFILWVFLWKLRSICVNTTPVFYGEFYFLFLVRNQKYVG